MRDWKVPPMNVNWYNLQFQWLRFTDPVRNIGQSRSLVDYYVNNFEVRSRTDSCIRLNL
jgi:hypothetical protein